MKLGFLFSRSSAQGKRIKTVRVAPEASPPAYVSGHDGGERGPNGLSSFADPSLHETNLYLRVIRALQSEPVVKQTSLKGLQMFGNKPAASGPDSLRPYALYELGFVSHPKRAARIAKGLIKVNAFDKHGALVRRDIFAERGVERLHMGAFSGEKNLTAQEAKGVEIYLESFMENLQMLGQDLTQSPNQLRPDWIFLPASSAAKLIRISGWSSCNSIIFSTMIFYPSVAASALKASRIISALVMHTPQATHIYIWFSEGVDEQHGQKGA